MTLNVSENKMVLRAHPVFKFTGEAAQECEALKGLRDLKYCYRYYLLVIVLFNKLRKV